MLRKTKAASTRSSARTKKAAKPVRAAGKVVAVAPSTKARKEPAVLRRLRTTCLTFPQSHEVEAWGAPTFRLRNKLFAMFAHASDHNGGGRNGVWIKCTKVNQQLLIASDPGRYFSPPYVGPSGWIGVYLDGKTDWKSVKELLYDAYLSIAPVKLKKLLEGE
jgi:predicted DNA-binding protein (MmcQ/YjbR family)